MSTREKILEAALTLFSENGYAATSVRQIAREVGVRESALYNHFESKEAILRGLFQQYGAGRSRKYLKRTLFKEEALKNPKAFLQNEIVGEILNFISNEKANQLKKIVVMEMFSGESGRELIEKELFESAVTTMQEVFQILMDEGQIEKTYDTGLLAIEFISPLLFLNLRYLLHIDPDRAQFKALAEGHVEFFLNKIIKGSN